MSGFDIDVVERRGLLGVARIHVHDDVILIEHLIDGRDQLLSEGIVEDVVDVDRRNAEP